MIMDCFVRIFLFFYSIFFCFYSASAFASESIGLIEKWPDEKSGLLTVAKGRLFFGDVREIMVLDTELNILNSIPINGYGEINDLHFSKETPDILYVAMGTGGVVIVDISDPDNREKTGRVSGTITTDGFCTGIAVHNGTAYAANGNSGLRLIDVANPSVPVVKGDPFLPGAISQVFAKKVAVSGSRVFVTDVLNGLWSLDADVSDYSSGFGILTFPGAYSVKPLPGSGTELMLAGGEKIVPVDAGPKIPVVAGEGLTLGRPVDMLFASGRLYAADSKKGVVHISLSGSGVQLIGTTKETGMLAHSLAISGERIFAGDHRFGIRSFDVSGSIIPERFSGPSIRLSPCLSGIAVQDNGNIVYATVSDPLNSSGNGMLVFDTSTMLQPSVIGRIKLPGEPGVIKIADKTAYVASGSGGLRIVDISNFESFREKAGIVFSGIIHDLALSGNLVYLAAGSAGLRIVDVSDPANPVEKGNFAPDGISCNRVAISGNTAYLADQSSGIRIVDVNIPENPKQVSVVAGNGRVMGLTSSGHYLYVGNSETGLEVYDISNASSPEFKGKAWVQGGETPWMMSVADNIVFVALGEKGMAAFDVSKPEAPEELKGWKYEDETVTGVWGKSGDPMFAYLSADNSGLRIIGLDRSDETEEKPPFIPVPFGSAGKHGECFIRSILW